MTEKKLTLTINLNFTGIILLVALLHVIALAVSTPWLNIMEHIKEFHQRPLVVRQIQVPKIRTLGDKESKKKNILITPKAPSLPDRRIDPSIVQNQQKPNLSKPTKPQEKTVAEQKKLQENKQEQEEKGVVQVEYDRNSVYRPRGRDSAINRMQVSQRSVKDFLQENPVGGMNPNSPVLSQTGVNAKVEVPEGVSESELNEFELKFYAFQKRIMVKYVESILLQVREREKSAPHKRILPDGQHIMTGRVVFDREGNIKRIKMVRWTNDDNLQQLFEEALKNMHALPNPPKVLWEKDGEFSVFYNLTVNG